MARLRQEYSVLSNRVVRVRPLRLKTGVRKFMPAVTCTLILRFVDRRPTPIAFLRLGP